MGGCRWVAVERCGGCGQSHWTTRLIDATSAAGPWGPEALGIEDARIIVRRNAHGSSRGALPADETIVRAG